MTVRIIPRPVTDTLGEGLFWSARDNALFWTDILLHRLWRLSFADNHITHWDMPERIGWIIGRESGGFVIGLQSGFHALSLEPFAITPLADPEPDLPDNRLNDAKADAHGRIWAGTMPVSAGPPQAWPATGALYRFDTDGRIGRHDSSITIANGPAISPDGATLFHTDSARGVIYRFAFHPDGSLGPRAVHLQFDVRDGAPDGMTCDSNAGLWVALYGGSRVCRFHPDGRLDRSIALPTPQITNVAFAGPALDRMFVTSAGDGRPDDPHAGALFEIDSGARGFAPYLYRG